MAKARRGDAKALNNKLAVTQESLDTTRRDNAELKSRMTDLQSQLDKLQRLIELKNNQLAKLQAEGAAGAPAATPRRPHRRCLPNWPRTPAAPTEVVRSGNACPCGTLLHPCRRDA